MQITDKLTFRRGTTPTLTITLDEPELLQNSTLYLSIKQQRHMLVKSGTALTVDRTAGTIQVQLSQAETLQYREGSAQIQIRGVTAAGNAWATDIASIEVQPVLQNGVIAP